MPNNLHEEFFFFFLRMYMRKFKCGRVDPVDNKRLLIWMGFPLLKITLIFIFI